MQKMQPGYGSLLRSLEKSSPEPTQIRVIKGEIPKWIEGSLYRNGPGRFIFNDLKYAHLFDGQSCVHKFTLRDGQVFYSNRLLPTKAYTRTVEEKKLFANFGTIDSENNLIKRILAFNQPRDTNDNVNVNVVPYANKYLFALTESSKFCELNTQTLDIVDTVDLKQQLPDLTLTVAHPHVENDGSWFTIGIVAGLVSGTSYYEFLRYTIDGCEKENNLRANMHRIARVPSSHRYGFCYTHSFTITKNYLIYLEQALVLWFSEAAKGLVYHQPVSKAVLCDKNTPTRIHIVNRNTGEVVGKKYVTDPQYSFHFINSFETDDQKEIMIDLCSYNPEYFDINNFTYDNMRSGVMDETEMFKGVPRRIRVRLDEEPAAEGKDEIYCEIRDLSVNAVMELPTINYAKKNAVNYKYAYGVNHHRKPYSIVKINTENASEVLEMKYFSETDGQANFLPNEPVFVEKPNAQSEDDGVLLVMVLSEPNDFLSVLDAKTLTEIARAEFPPEVKAAFTFHGFFADKATFPNMS